MKKIITTLALGVAVTAVASEFIWNGVQDSKNWDTQTANFFDKDFFLPIPVAFTAGGKAVFDDTRDLTAGKTLYVIGDMNCDSMKVNNDTCQYIMRGKKSGTQSAQLSGTGVLLKTGAGELVMDSITNLKGTVINKGKIRQLNANTIDFIGPSLKFTGNATVEYGQNAADKKSVCNANIDIPEGVTANMYFTRYQSITGDLTGKGTLNFYSSGERSYVKFDVGADWSGFAGQLNICKYDMGYKPGFHGIILQTGKNWAQTKKVAVAPGDTITVPDPQADSTFYNKSIRIKSGASIASMSGIRCYVIGELQADDATCSLLGYYTKSTTPVINYMVGGLNTSVTFPALIIPKFAAYNKVGIIKVGTGTYKFTNGRNNITAGIEVREGRVFISNPEETSSGNGQTTITVLQNGALGGTGRISGNVDCSGSLEPGENGIGSLTIADTLNAVSPKKVQLFLRSTAVTTMEIKDINNYDKIVGVDSVRFDGKLVIKLAEGKNIAATDTFRIFNMTGGATVNSTGFTSVELPDIAPLKWDTTQLKTNGYISVTGTSGVITPEASAVSVFPNPCNGVLNISLTAGNGISLSVFNGQGTLVLTQAVSAVENQINLEGLAKGIYLINIKTTEGIIVKKVALQ